MGSKTTNKQERQGKKRAQEGMIEIGPQKKAQIWAFAHA